MTRLHLLPAEGNQGSPAGARRNDPVVAAHVHAATPVGCGVLVPPTEGEGKTRRPAGETTRVGRRPFPFPQLPRPRSVRNFPGARPGLALARPARMTSTARGLHLCVRRHRIARTDEPGRWSSPRSALAAGGSTPELAPRPPSPVGRGASSSP